MDVKAIRIRKRDGDSFIKVLIKSDRKPISEIKDKKWLEGYNCGYTFSEEFFEKLRTIKVEEMKRKSKKAEKIISELFKDKELQKEIIKSLPELLRQNSELMELYQEIKREIDRIYEELEEENEEEFI